MTELSPFERLSLSTVRIECRTRDGSISTGTGFFMKFLDRGSTYVQVIITNRHVVRDAEEGSFLFTLSDQAGQPDFGRTHRYYVSDFDKPWLKRTVT